MIHNREAEPSRLTQETSALPEEDGFSSSGDLAAMHYPHTPCQTHGTSAAANSHSPIPPMETRGWWVHIRGIQKLDPRTDTREKAV